MKPQKGMLDKLALDCKKEEEILNVFKGLCYLFALDEVKTPIIEGRSLFETGLGDSSDVVSKEMFKVGSGNRFKESFDKLVLRPEGTAGVVRQYLNSKNPYPQRCFYVGSMFRKENPQKGRFREFTQGGVEFIKSNPQDIFDGLKLADSLLDKLGIKYDLKINYLGSRETQKKVSTFLSSQLDKSLLSPESQSRIEKNPLRILDSKSLEDQEYLKKINFSYESFLSPEELASYKKIQNFLKSQNIHFVLDPLLVRGLDYYQNLVFEFQSPDLGSQSAVLAGGEYQGLLGLKSPCFGWAFGLERLALLTQAPTALASALINLCSPSDEDNFFLLQKIRSQGISVKPLFKKNLQKSMDLANKMGFNYCLIFGENEKSNKTITVKRLKDGVQNEMSIKDLPRFINKKGSI